jgi:hypothetical protein
VSLLESRDFTEQISGIPAGSLVYNADSSVISRVFRNLPEVYGIVSSAFKAIEDRISAMHPSGCVPYNGEP